MRNIDDYKDIVQSDFTLVQSDAKIHDQKFETKPTTFIKDAFKRFCKNKSSVIGAIILGFLILLALIVPMVSTHDIDTVRSGETFLAPKLFEVGTGFWDGTRKFTNVTYDTVNMTPAGFRKSAVVKINVYSTPELINKVNDYGKNGYVMFELEKGDSAYLSFEQKFSFSKTDDVNVTFTLFDEENALESKLGMYSVELIDNKNQTVVMLQDYSKNYGTISLNLSSLIESAGKDFVTDVKLAFKLKGVSEGVKQYILLKDLQASSTSTNETLLQVLNNMSFSDATRMSSYTAEDVRYWRCNGRKGIYKSELYKCDFVLDTYADKYNDDINEDPSQEDSLKFFLSDLQKLRDEGIITYNDSTLKKEEDFLASLTIIDEEKCPFSEVLRVNFGKIEKKVQSIDAKGERYKKYGYEKMPIFLFGTDVSGQDVFTKAFAGLRTSLILGVLTAAFCFIFGLVWGSISGYFGGTVDIIMERFCEILGGVPWIVVMTLAILIIGNNFVTFFFALCLTGWMGTAARTRTQFYRFKGREYILSSRTLGASDTRLIFKHILPNSLGTVVTGSVLMIPSVIFSEATLAYLNLGLQGVHSFGVLLSDNQKWIANYPNLVIFPAVIVSLMMISFNLFGNGLRDALNPSLKGTE